MGSADARKEATALSREALLRAGEELLLEAFAAGGLDLTELLSPSAIAERAGRSKGMLYHLWPVPADNPDRLSAYRSALLERLGWWTAIDVEELLAVAAARRDEPVEVFLRDVANWLVGLVEPGGERAPMHRLLSMLAMAAEVRGDQPAESGDSGPIAHHPALEELYEATLQAYGREMVPPMTTAHLGAMLWAALDGVALNLASSPALSQRVELEDRDGVWTTYAVMVDAIVDRVTRPVE